MLAERMKGLNPYIPGEQPKDRNYIKLNANENPYPPAPEVCEAIRNFIEEHPEKLGLYPDPDSYELHCQIAKMLNDCGGVLCRSSVKDGRCMPSQQDKIPFEVTPEMIYAGNGSDEVLSFVFYAFFDSDRPVITPTFSYSFYPVYCGFYDIPIKKVELKPDWSLDTEKMLEEAVKTDSGMIFANPNAPTGIALTREQVRQMLKKAPADKAFVVDEAYVDFGGESCIPLLAEFKNLIVVRTFSKSLCGAGLRSGYLVANPEVIQAITTVKNSLNHFPIDAVTQIASAAACKASGYYAEKAMAIARERDSFSEFLKAHGWNVLPSKTNFVFAQKPEVDGQYAYKKIKQDGILVRIFSTPGIENYLRISIGTAEQMAVLKKSMESL